MAVNVKPKIAVIAPCPFYIDRGTPLRIRRLATAASENFDVYVIAFGQGETPPVPFRIQRTIRIPLKILRSGANLAKVLYDILLLIKTIAIVRREKIPIVDGHLHEGALIGIFTRAFTGCTVIYNAHGTFTNELIATGAVSGTSWLIRPLRWLERFVETSVDMIVAQSELRKNEFIASGHPAEKISVIEDVPELDIFHIPQDEIDRDLERILRPNGEQLLIYSGGMEEYQGVDFLLEAFIELCRSRNNIRLILFGRPLGKYLTMAEQAGVADYVIGVEHEPFERLPQYLAISDIGFALRLYGDNVPGKLPVYLASGIPVIGTTCKGIHTVITHGQTGILVAPNDIAGLTSAICTLLDDPLTATRIGAAGRKEALRRYSPLQVTAQLSATYQTLITRKTTTT